TPAEIVRRGVLTSPELARLTEYALALYRRGSALAATRGLLLLDTKFEFGRTPEGDVLVIDEILTPDSSRYVYAEDYEARVAAGEPPRHLSKEFLREWLLTRGFRGDGPPPALPDDLRVAVAHRYIELFETLTGTPFEPDDRDLSIAITA
ncbi:MAG TPA: phosphoribosylaminoimidazolesuccinocarboxamide synthase, partial [Rhodothermales bacterium]|nr:phosphoribosylaminoimidazolesuccinocarboxamide synthase [Rhodothermales bacterium]